MGRLSARWRRFWGIRPGELRPPLRLIGLRRTMGEPSSGPHGRGWRLRRRVFATPPREEASSETPRAAPTDPVAAPQFPVTVAGTDDFGEEARRHALEALARVARFAPHPVLHGRLTLRRHHDPAIERPVEAKASLDVNGRPVRAHVAAREMIEAIDLLEQRLRRNLDDLAELERARRRESGVAERGEWRHGDLPTARPPYFPRPVEERELMRRKSLALSELMPEEAALEMRALDYDFHLFRNADTKEENVVYRGPDGSLALAEITPRAERRTPPFHVEPAPAPVMTAEQAAERLNATGERFVFFTDAETRRGNLLYLRYDGHYGLIEPAQA